MFLQLPGRRREQRPLLLRLHPASGCEPGHLQWLPRLLREPLPLDLSLRLHPTVGERPRRPGMLPGAASRKLEALPITPPYPPPLVLKAF